MCECAALVFYRGVRCAVVRLNVVVTDPRHRGGKSSRDVVVLELWGVVCEEVAWGITSQVMS